MRTGWAIIIAAVIVGAAGIAAAYLAAPRFALGNPGGGVSVRLDRRTGDMIGCERLDCQPVVKGGSIQKVQHGPWEDYGKRAD